MATHDIVIALLSLILPLLVNDATAAEPPSYRSELWRMEFQAPDDVEDSSQSNNSPRNGSEPARTAAALQQARPAQPDGRSSSNHPRLLPETASPTVAERGLPGLGVPEFSMLPENYAASPVQTDSKRPGVSWAADRVTGFRHISREEPVRGPTVTTIAVAIAACIAVFGALYAGRE